MMAWQDLCVSGDEGHSNKTKILGQCELLECLQGVMQQKSSLVPRVQSREKKPKRNYCICPEINFKKIYMLYGGNFGQALVGRTL